MTHPQPSSHGASFSRRFSTFLSGDAISTAASPLQASFHISCRSPIHPRHDAEEESTSLYGSQAASPRHGYSPHGEPHSRHTHINTDSRAVEWKVWEHQDSRADNPPSDTDPKNPAWRSELDPTSLPVDITDDEGKLGVMSAINIIMGKTIGVGVYSIPSAVFAGVGSVGMALLLWVVGAIISFCGLSIYLDLGTALPSSGGERVYLERIFGRPRMLATCMFMAYSVLLGFSAPNALVLGQYMLYELDLRPGRWNARAIAVAAVSCLCWVHARHPRLGVRLINVLGVAKMLMLVVVVLAGVAGGLMGVGADRELPAALSLLTPRRADAVLSGVAPRSTAQRNFSDIWAGSSAQPYDYATALLKVLYCFRGYNTANQVLGDVRNPVRTLKIAAPVALSLVACAYLAVNLAFLLVVDKDDFKSAGVVVAGIFFRNVFGPVVGARVLPLFVIVSAAGNIAATTYAQARVNEELARDGLLPWSRFWATPTPAAGTNPATQPELDPELNKNKNIHPHLPPSSSSKPAKPNATRGLLLHWLISVLVILLPPPGRIYNFLVDIGGYPVSVLSVSISLGLLYLHASPREQWRTPFRAPTLAVALFAVSNCLLLILPWIPPAGGKEEQDGKKGGAGGEGGFVWFAYPATALAVLLAGAVWWVWWVRWGNGKSQKGNHDASGSWVDGWTKEDRTGNDEAAQGLLSG
ncbi:amino acid transporter-like protein [Podospora appendiculata]|uniref:Amino acid transporter-like protein n=1 Tax=Podospora appendiculata TaxID=314037 RepID=A0AAE0XKT2_9PEZI|nr:amino acid transporter-like protein [Podospora appendiculata]